VRNVPTHARGFYGGGGTRAYGNSIFLFNTAGICIAHLGHLHHLLNDVILSEIGKIDVVMVPIDGMYTMSQDDAIDALEKIKAPLNMPMHYFGQHTLNRFLDKARGKFAITMSPTSTISITRSDLPENPEILVLPGR
jgi:L-ascorbate metabolism protein UlaG (beta-lactamase superfamily)